MGGVIDSAKVTELLAQAHEIVGIHTELLGPVLLALALEGVRDEIEDLACVVQEVKWAIEGDERLP